MSINTDELEKILRNLKEAIDFAEKFKISKDEVQFKIARDACIQRFEYSLELCWKTAMKKLGSATKFAKPAVCEMARADLIQNSEIWLGFVEARNESSHSYDEDVAKKIYVEILSFYKEAISVLEKLQKI